MLSLSDADKLVQDRLGDTPRAGHSRLVGRIMRHLGERFSADSDLWEIVGLCHDLDFFAVASDWARHGRQTVQWLEGQLPAEALAAIAAHDHRTGVQANTLLADMLKLADATAIIAETLGAETVSKVRGESVSGELRGHFGSRAYLVDIADRYCERHRLDVSDLLRLASSLVVKRQGDGP